MNENKTDAYQVRFKQAIENDLNTSSMMTLVYDVLKDEELSDFSKLYFDVVGEDLKKVWVDDDFCIIHFNEEGSESESFVEMNPSEAGLKVEQILRKYLEDKRRQDQDFICDENYEKALTIIVNKLENKKWVEYFDYFAQENNLRNVSYEIGSKEQKEALYRIKISTNQQTLDRLAEIASSPDLNEILEKVERKLELEKEKKRQFVFTYAIGKHIEDILPDYYGIRKG